MSVLIKHMAIPKGCIYANDKDQTEYCPLLNHDDVPFCQYIENEPEIAIGIDERPVYCPLFDVSESCQDTVSRAAAIDALDEIESEIANGYGYQYPKWRKYFCELPSAQPDLDSAYTEGYTQAEAKYRKMWDEMQANIKEKAFGKRKGLVHTADICLIDRDALLARYDATHVGPPGKARDLILNAPTIEPEPIKEGLFPDGTLHLFTDTDLSKVDRVLVSQNGTHFGDLYYADGEPKIGKWKRHYSRPNVYADLCWHCSNCGYSTPDNWANKWKFCPHCGASMMEGEDNDS